MEYKNITIGIFLDRLNTSFHEEVLSGIIDFSRENKVNLFIFVTGWYDSSYYWEKKENILLNFTKSELLDGIILFSSIGQIKGLESLYNSVISNDKPTVIIGRNLSNLPTVSVDNNLGISLIMEHLVDLHGAKKIAFIKGPEHNTEATERLTSFIENMKKRDLKIDSRWIIEGNFLIDSGKKAAEYVIKKLNLDLDAIICANDLTAFGLIDELKKRRPEKLENLRIVGFDDIDVSESYNLTTIHQPFYNIGYRATKLCYNNILKNTTINEKIFLKPHLIIRNSCGCKRKNDQIDISNINIEEIRDFLKENQNIFPINKIFPNINKIEKIDDFFSYFDKENTSPILVKELSILIEKRYPSFSDLLKKYIKDKLVFYDFKFKNYLLKINEIGENLLSFRDNLEKFDYIYKNFPDIGITSFYLCFYENENSPINFSRLVFGFDRFGKFKLNPKGERFITEYLIPVDYRPREDYYHYFVYDIFSFEKQIGYILFNIGELDLSLYDFIKDKSFFNYISFETPNIDSNKKMDFCYRNRELLEQNMLIFETDILLNFTEFFIGKIDNKENLLSLIDEKDRKSFLTYFDKIQNGIRKFHKFILNNEEYHLLGIKNNDKIFWVGFKSELLSKDAYDDIKLEIIIKKFGLTEKEGKILELLLKGLKNKEIADKLYISENTVKNYTNKIYTKLNIKNKKEIFEKIKDF